MIAADRDIDFHAGRHVIAQHLTHVTEWLLAQIRLLIDHCKHDLPVFRFGFLAERDQNILVEMTIVGTNRANSAFLKIATHHRLIGAREHLNHIAIRSLTFVVTRHAH